MVAGSAGASTSDSEQYINQQNRTNIYALKPENALSSASYIVNELAEGGIGSA